MPKLTWTVKGAERSVEVEDSCSIGRVPGNTIALEDEAGASRRHCQILKIKDGYELADLGSTNGTKVNGTAAKRQKLKDGDEIRIGETVLRWSEGGGGGADSEEEILLEEPAGAGPAAGTSAGGGSQSGEQCFLVHAGGPKDGQKIALDKKRVTFGRNPKNSFVLEDAMASGYHCEIAREGGAWLLRDLGSTNGTLVDGEPVTETALAHGARIRIGGTRFVFIDPTVSDFEKAMSAVEDLGSEWGLLRAEMDLDRVQKARRSQAVAIGGVMVLLAGAGYVAVAHPEWISSAPKPLVYPAGNVIAEADFSFESLRGTWTNVAESPAQTHFADASDGAAAQGTAFYAVARDGAPGRAAAVQSGETYTVDPSRPYTFGAKVRVKGGGRAAVRIAWLSSDLTVLGRSSTDALAATDWTEAKRTVARPARDASRMRIELANVGTGTAYFDDLYLGSGEAVSEVSAKDGEVAWRVTTDGQATLSRGTATLLADMAAVGGALRSEATDPSKRPERVGGSSDVAIAGNGVRGTVLDPAGTSGAFEFSGTPAEGRYVDLTATLPADAALLGRLAAEFVDEGIGVRMSSKDYVRVSDVRIMDRVTAVTFGDRNRFQVSAVEGTTFRFALLRTEEGWLVGLGAEDGKLAVRIDTDSAKLKEGVIVTASRAADAERGRRLGEAVSLYAELAGLLPAGNQQAEAARELSAKLDREGLERLRVLTENVDAAILYQDDAGLSALEDECNALAALYATHAAGDGAAEQLKKVAAAIDKRRVVVAERRAAPFLARGEDYEKRGARRIAEAVYRGILDSYAGTEAAKTAQAGLERLRAGK